ncbi:hypothetical protein BSKO_12041 [Bryopsis sp. KO-2023]|nr:hypothetical protein BSKO_12041 [Bryopsis sp. KO-2023]
MPLVAESICHNSRVFLTRSWVQRGTAAWGQGYELKKRRTGGIGQRKFLCQSSVETTEIESTNDVQKPGKAYRQRVLSGVQPTGNLHLGNYLGAVKNWVGLQELYDTSFCVVDMHGITVPHDPKVLRESTKSTAALYIASGIDPEKATVFVQSHVPAHAELFWLLNCICPIGWLNRMIQFKEKSAKMGDDVRAGLLTYPVLMAADILLYQADLVPVGEDQRQHLELARDLAERMNYLYGGKKWKKMGGRNQRLLKVPEAFIRPAGARVMSLQDATNKMSKSAESDLTRINLLDTPAEIKNKIKKAKTDAFSGLEFGNIERPECSNLLVIYQLVTGMSMESVENEVGSMKWGQFKPLLADAIVAHLEPVQNKYREVMEDSAYVDKVLLEGSEKASELANRTLENCYQAMGFDRGIKNRNPIT